MRVFELCEFANEKEITDLALKYASRTRNEKLAERLIDLRNFQLQEMETENRPNVERYVRWYQLFKCRSYTVISSYCSFRPVTEIQVVHRIMFKIRMKRITI